MKSNKQIACLVLLLVFVTNASTSAQRSGALGYSPNNPHVLASFFIAGPGIKKGLDLGQIDLTPLDLDKSK